MNAPWSDNIPADWDGIPLKYLTEIRTGGTPDRSEDSYWGGDIPWVSSKDMVSEEIDDAQEYITEEAVESTSTAIVPKETLLIVSRSGILKHTIPVAVTTKKVAINQDIRAYVPQEDRILIRFLRDVILGHEQSLLKLWRQQGATVQSLNSLSVSETEFPVPPKDVQQDIIDYCSDAVSAIDQSISAVNSLKRNLDEKRVTQIWKEVTHSKPTDKERYETDIPWLGMIPEDWGVTKIGWKYDIQLGKMLDESEIDGDSLEPYLRNKDVQWWEISTEDLPQMDFTEQEKSKYQLKEGDILVCEGGEAGRSAIWEGSDQDIFYQKALHRVRPKNNNQIPEFFCFFMEFAVKRDIFSSKTNQSTIEHLQLKN